ncbi:hypothetical protein EV361DRAFT_973375 [Lentinula raphanica]|nr:hypothetical protein EV361DRAFT_973375 [Lentinula raphanica]
MDNQYCASIRWPPTIGSSPVNVLIPSCARFFGRLPSDLHLLTLSYLPVPDFSAYARSESERVWETRWKSLNMDNKRLGAVLDDLEEHSKGRAAESRAAAPPTANVDDEFGDIASVDVPPDEMGDLVGAFQNPTTPITASLWTSTSESNSTFLTPSLRLEAPTGLRLLFLFLSQTIQPVRKWREYKFAFRSAMDKFDANLLAAFDHADEKGDEDVREAAESSWLVWDGASSDWEMGKVWAEKRGIFYDQPWDSLANFTKDRHLTFDAMDDFMSIVLKALSDHGSRAVRVLPPEAGVLISFSERVDSKVVGDFRMFEPNMDEYLDEETEAIKPAFEAARPDVAIR